jgi:hypothetical protein
LRLFEPLNIRKKTLFKTSCPRFPSQPIDLYSNLPKTVLHSGNIAPEFEFEFDFDPNPMTGRLTLNSFIFGKRNADIISPAEQ